MTELSEKEKKRLEFASKSVREHDDARSLYGIDNVERVENNAEREAEGLYPIITEIYEPNNIPGYDPAEHNVTSSARSNFWARSGDGRIEDTRPLPPEKVALANAQYDARPDIESHADVLARSAKAVR